MVILRTISSGAAARHFQRTFVLAEGMQVLGADLKNGLLSIDLARPEPEKVVKTIAINGSEDVPGLFPQAPKIAPGLKLFALHAADGTPIMLTDSREAAIANAWSNELQAVSVH